MEKYGHVIKFERIRQDIKQVALAKDICSPAYLSKIESNSVVPSEEIREKLFVRLNLNSSPSARIEEDFLEYVRSIYFEAIMYKDRPLTLEKLEEILAEQYLFNDLSNYYTYQLMVFRLSFIVYDLKSEEGDLVSSLSEMSSNFDDYQSFLFHTIVGIYYSLKADYTSSLDYLEQANVYLQRIKIDKWEEADFYYIMAHSYFIHQRWVIAVEYIQKSLEFFKNSFYNTRVVECYLILAGAQDKSHKTEKAFDNLLLAKRIANQLNLTEHIPVISHNLGSLSSTKEEHDNAIAYFKESLELRFENSEKVIPIFSLIKEYSKLGREDEVVKWSSLGLDIIHSEKNSLLTNYLNHFSVYRSRNSGFEDFEKVTVSAIQFFREIKDYRYAQKYSLFLAEYFKENKKYKKAAKYYALSNEYMFKKQKVNFEEDL